MNALRHVLLMELHLSKGPECDTGRAFWNLRQARGAAFHLVQAGDHRGVGKLVRKYLAARFGETPESIVSGKKKR